MTGKPRSASARAFVAILDGVRRRTPLEAPGEILRSLVKEVDYAEYLRRTEGSEADPRLENVEQLIDAASEAEGPEGLQGFLDRASLVSDADSAEGDRGVNLMTLHSAKGLEFDLVCLVGMEEGLCPHARTIGSEDEIEEERRLAYVGMTRARKRLYLTAAGTRRTYGEVAPVQLSRFLAEIGDEHLEEVLPSASGFAGAVSRGASRPRGREVALGDEDVSLHDDDDGGASFRVGSRVRHDQFGLGEVLLVEPADEGQKLTVRFGGRTRKLLTRFARLTTVRS